MESDVHSSLHLNCHHQVVFAKLDLKVFHPLLLEREIWHYNKANTDLILRSIHELCWENKFSNTDANQKVYLFNETIENILSNFTSHETIVCDDRDSPCINNKIKNLIAEKNIAKKCYLQNNSDIQLFQRFQSLWNLLVVSIEKSKQQFYSRISNHLIDLATIPKPLLVDTENVSK